MSTLPSEYRSLGNGCFEFVPADDVQPPDQAETIKLLEGFGYRVAQPTEDKQTNAKRP
jgi:hypothetical protein